MQETDLKQEIFTLFKMDNIIKYIIEEAMCGCRKSGSHENDLIATLEDKIRQQIRDQLFKELE